MSKSFGLQTAAFVEKVREIKILNNVNEQKKRAVKII